MHKVEGPAELETLRQRGRGFIINARFDRGMLHRAKCESLEAMVISAYDKWFSEDFEEATYWLDAEYGPGRWEVCGRCRATG